jgi:glycosyltransferase involved in cell wall biosynthesis
MRVTHLIRPAGVGGVERYLLALLPALQAKGVDVDLLLLAGPDTPVPPLGDLAATAGLPVTTQRIARRIDPGLVMSLADHLHHRQPDLLHTHRPMADAYGILAGRRAGVRGVVSSHYRASTAPSGFPTRLLTRQMWRYLAFSVAASEAARRFSIESEGAPPDRIMTIPYGLAPDGLRVGQGARAVLSAELGLGTPDVLVGIFCPLDLPATEIEQAIRAFWHVATQHADAHLLVVGDGPARSALLKRVQGYGLKGRVHLLGPRNDALAILAALDVLLVLCGQEGAAMTALEGMALGTAVIAPEGLPAAETVVHGESGLLVTPGDDDQLTSSLGLLLDDANVRTMLGENGRERATHGHTAAQAAQQVLEIYTRIAG